MPWNYRVIELDESSDEPFFEIREVYYDDAGSIEGWTEHSAGVCSESLEGMLWVLKKMRSALDKAPLKESDLLRLKAKRKPEFNKDPI